MIRRMIFVLGLALAGQLHAAWTLGPIRELGSLGGSATAWEREATQGDRRVRISGVTFSDRQATFQVIDNPPDARISLSEALKKAGAVAGINASYFHPDFTPLGLTVSQGKTIHPYEKAKLLSGLLLVQKGRIELIRASSPGSASHEQALQAGPWLVEKGTPIATLNAEKLARRSVIITDGKGHWGIVALSSASLAETAAILAQPGFAGTWSVRDSLNLDGGSSTALTAFANGRSIISIPSFGPVRNYLAIVPR